MPGESAQVLTLRSPQEMAVIEDLQKEIWGYGEPGSDPPYPARALFALAESGGLVSLAMVEGEPVGFAVAWQGRTESGGYYLHSQLVGVRALYRRAGIAQALKLHQRDFAIGQGLELVRWTFDPLRAANARLNLRRLGAICRDFRANYYGPLGSRFSAGDESDRVWADWFVRSARVRSCLEGVFPDRRSGAVSVITADQLTTGTGSFRCPSGWLPATMENRVLAEIPADLDLLRACRPDLVARWRLSLREVLAHYISQGFLVTGIAEPAEPGAGPSYVLERNPLDAVLG